MFRGPSNLGSPANNSLVSSLFLVDNLGVNPIRANPPANHPLDNDLSDLLPESAIAVITESF
jgi:hypothetical protein